MGDFGGVDGGAVVAVGGGYSGGLTEVLEVGDSSAGE